MKNVWLIAVSLFVWHTAVAQNTPCPEIPYIEVTGSADMEIEPDEFRLSVLISAYEKDKKEIKVEEVEKKLMKILSNIGIPKNNILLSTASTRSDWEYAWKIKKEGKENKPRVTKLYDIICADFKQMDDLIAQLPGVEEGFMEINLSELKNKNISEYRKQTKIEAIKAAKEKAGYLLESVGNTTGKLIQVIELDEDDWGWPRAANAYSNAISQTSMKVMGDTGDDSSVRKIKLRYKIKARFEIK